MECTCVRQTDLPNTSTLYADLIYHFDRVKDLYPFPPNDPAALIAASKFDFPDDRRAALVEALRPLNAGNPALDLLATPGTVAVVTGQQVGLFSGPAYTIFKALTAIRIAEELNAQAIPAVPVFWLATEDHDFAEVNHSYVFGPDHKPLKLEMDGPNAGLQPVGDIPLGDVPFESLRQALDGFPFAAEALAILQKAYVPGASMGSAFAEVIKELFAPYGLLVIDPMTHALRKIAAPLMRRVIEEMPELIDALIERSEELVKRGYHAQVLVEKQTSLAFLLEDNKRLAMRRLDGHFAIGHRQISVSELADRADSLSPNALLRPVLQDYMLPTVAYVGGPAELAYLAQSQVLYQRLLGHQPVAFPRAGFTILDSRARKRMERYGLSPMDLFRIEPELRAIISRQLVPGTLQGAIDSSTKTAHQALEDLQGALLKFDPSLAKALENSQRKIAYQIGKIARKTANQILSRDKQAENDVQMLHGLAFPERHLQERLYSIIPFYAKFGPALIEEIHSAVKLECPDHQLLTL